MTLDKLDNVRYVVASVRVTNRTEPVYLGFQGVRSSGSRQPTSKGGTLDDANCSTQDWHARWRELQHTGQHGRLSDELSAHTSPPVIEQVSVETRKRKLLVGDPGRCLHCSQANCTVLGHRTRSYGVQRCCGGDGSSTTRLCRCLRRLRSTIPRCRRHRSSQDGREAACHVHRNMCIAVERLHGLALCTCRLVLSRDL